MAIPFATAAWLKALMTALNSSEHYAEAAKTWEGDFYLVVTKGPGTADDICMYLDLWRGKCRAAEIVVDRTARSPEFELIAPLETWQKVVTKKIDPIRELVTGRLKLKGPKMKVLRSPKAASELVECCARLDTSWPP